MKITSDLHVHTALSSCAKPEATVAFYMDKAREIGLKTLGFTDHLWDSAIPNANGFYRPQDFAHILQIKEELDKADKTGIDLSVLMKWKNALAMGSNDAFTVSSFHKEIVILIIIATTPTLIPASIC